MINKISPAYNSYMPVFYGKDKISSPKKDKFTRTTEELYPERKEIKKIYNSLWEELKLPENLKPPLQFRALFSDLGFSFYDYAIFINKNLKPFKLRVDIQSGNTKALLAHEIEHVKQIWSIIRLLGADKFKSAIDTEESDFRNIKKYKLIEKTLGKLSPDSDEGKEALKCWNSLKKYTNVERSYGLFSIREIIDYLNYNNNYLEKNARSAAKKFKPNKAQILKIKFDEYLKLLKQIKLF